MRVLFCFTEPHWPDAKFGLTVTAHALCKALMRMGTEVAVLCRRLDQAATQKIVVTEELGYPVYRAIDPSAQLLAVTQAWQPTRVVVQLGQPTSPLVLAAMATGRPYAVYAQSVDAMRLDATFPIDFQGLRLANSSFTAKRWQGLFGGQWFVIPPVIHASDYASEGGPHDRVLFVNPVPAKGAELAFEIAKLCPDLPFTFIQSWGLPQPWGEACRLRALALANVQWLSPVTDMRPLYAQARVVLVPSMCEETFGRVVVEAQINGVPALASNRGALPQVVGDGGLVLDHHASGQEWASALLRLYASPEPYSQAAHQRGHQHSMMAPVIAAELLSLLSVQASA
jgi:hypothetical protein